MRIPLLSATYRATKHPLTRAVLGRIVRDEADHGTFGWTYLDWVLPHLGAEDRKALGATACLAIGDVHSLWEKIRIQPVVLGSQGHDLGWLGTEEYLSLAERSLEKEVITPLRERGIFT